MKKIILSILLFTNLFVYSQKTYEAVWDQGIPLCPDDAYITRLIDKLGTDTSQWNTLTNNSKIKLFREIGFAFYDKKMYDAADWYFLKAKNYKENVNVEKVEVKTEELVSEQKKENEKFLKSLPKDLENLPSEELKNILLQLEKQITKLKKQKELFKQDTLLNPKMVEENEKEIQTLEKEKNIVNLNIQNNDLEIEKSNLKKFLFGLASIILILVLSIIAIFQRKTIKIKDTEIIKQLKDINNKNSYLDYASKIIRHDMHSGINTYIPRGLNSLERRLNNDEIQRLNIESSLKMIKEGLQHTQRVYKSVYEFTNLVKKDVFLTKKETNLTELLTNYLSTTSYHNQVTISKLPILEVNEILFCNAVDNLIKNGLKYNNSNEKIIKVYEENGYLIIEDNGIGMSDKKFKKICSNYTNEIVSDDEKGLGLNITIAILNEHNFNLECEKIESGTKMKIKYK